MANETPDFMRAKNATDIASQVSVPISCHSSKKKVTVIIRTQIVLLLSNLLVSDRRMHVVSFLNICLVNPSNKRIKDPLLGLPPSAFLSLQPQETFRAKGGDGGTK